MADTLKPCPLCRSENVEIRYSGGAFPSESGFCNTCGCNGPLSTWNTPTPPPVPEDVVEMYRDARSKAANLRAAGRPQRAKARDMLAEAILTTIRLTHGPEGVAALERESGE